MIDLRNEPEILPENKNKPQILSGSAHWENMTLAVGFASRCWTETGVFDVVQAVRVVDELCAYIRLFSNPVNNFEYIEWLQAKKKGLQ